MRRNAIVLVWMTALSLLASCSDQGTTPESGSIQTQFQQIPGCVQPGDAIASSLESCFSYTFETNLDVTWCLPANCCPDSNRFVLASSIMKDTITVAAKDTARDLCRCLCSFNLRATFAGLPLDRYVFLVQFADSIFYRKTVYRTQ